MDARCLGSNIQIFLYPFDPVGAYGKLVAFTHGLMSGHGSIKPHSRTNRAIKVLDSVSNSARGVSC